MDVHFFFFRNDGRVEDTKSGRDFFAEYKYRNYLTLP